MFTLPFMGTVLLSYLIGALPFGFWLVKLRTGQDIRQVQSGRTGGTNAFRAAGTRIGLLTAVLDMLKAGATVALARLVLPENAWLHVLSPLAAILGHNHSIFMVRRLEDGRLKWGGGAGGASCVGGSLGLWPPSFLIIVPMAALVYFGIGFASISTLSVGVISTLVFAVRAWQGYSPWTYAAYGLLAEVLLILALLPNIRRLIEGTERPVGLRRLRQLRKQKSGADGRTAVDAASPTPEADPPELT
jgi:glycerol-3-phosphate acyltransferase PlsY